MGGRREGLPTAELPMSRSLRLLGYGLSSCVGGFEVVLLCRVSLLGMVTQLVISGFLFAL